jgi:hypothetical protein
LIVLAFSSIISIFRCDIHQDIHQTQLLKRHKNLILQLLRIIWDKKQILRRPVWHQGQWWVIHNYRIVKKSIFFLCQVNWKHEKFSNLLSLRSFLRISLVASGKVVKLGIPSTSPQKNGHKVEWTLYRFVLKSFSNSSNLVVVTWF